MSSKRSYVAYAGAPSANYKAARMVAGKVLRYNPTRPVAGSYRSRVSRAAVMRARKSEVKGMDTVITQTGIVSTVGTNANAQVLNLVQPGSGSWNRIGRKISNQSVRLRGVARYDTTFGATLSSSDNWLRMVVVWDQQPSGAAIPTYDTIFAITDQTGTEAGSILAPPRFDNMDRFTVLKDVVLHFSQDVSAASTGTTTLLCPFDMFIPLKGRETVFSGQSNPCTIADISTGALYVYYRAGASGVTVNASALEGSPYARLRYTD